MQDIFLQTNKHYEAIIYKEHKFTYGDLLNRVKCIKEELLYEGIQEGTHVTLKISNTLKYLEYFLALWQINATIIPIDSQVTNSNLVKILHESDAEFLILDTNDIQTINYLLEQRVGRANKMQQIVLLEGIKADKENWAKRNNLYMPFGYIILFTSGTSGQPKGVVLRKDKFLNNVQKVISYTGLKNNDSIYLTLPLTYSFGLSQLFAHLLVGGKIILSDANKLTSNILQKIEEYKVTNYAATPYFFDMLSKSKESHQVLGNNLKFFMNAGGYLSEQTIISILKQFPSVIFFNNYGQTEASPRLCVNKIIDIYSNYKSVGKPIDGVEIKIFDDFKNIIEGNSVGEIGYKSEDMMIGYYNREIIDRDEYIMSGDLGYLDNQNNLVIIGRKDSVIKINGRKIYKNVIEDHIRQLPMINNVQLKTETHNLYGQYFVAFIVLNSGFQSSEAIAEIKKYCKKTFNKYEIPRKIVICNDVELNSNQKVVFNDKEGSSYELYENG